MRLISSLLLSFMAVSTWANIAPHWKVINQEKEITVYRSRINDVILSKNNLVMKRLWNLDTNTYEEGALDKKTKEMLGLVVRREADTSL